jgi:prepilin-type processing-associated H-X9-DG protein
VKEGPDESQGGEAVEPESNKAEWDAKRAIRQLVILSAGCAIAAFVFGSISMTPFVLGLPFAAGGLAAGLFAVRRMKKRADYRRIKSASAAIVANGVLILIGVAGMFCHAREQRNTAHLAYRMICGTHMKALGECLNDYADRHGGQYPPAQEWCDYLIEDPNMHENLFVCSAARSAGSEARCHYAMNPNAKPYSAGDVVLLFETEGGWNLCSGRELMTFYNHEGEGCNILFVDGHVDFFGRDFDPNELNWGEADL